MICLWFPPALGSYAARSSLDVTVHVSVACVIPLLGISTHLETGTVTCTDIYIYIHTRTVQEHFPMETKKKSPLTGHWVISSGHV